MPKPDPRRLRYLDWTRGVAALIMLQGHTFHSFVRNDLRTQGPYILSQFVGGITPAVFLFLTGVTMAFRMDSDERHGMAPFARMLSALRRAGSLLLLAFLFRFQMWLFSLPGNPPSKMLKVDVLNCMAMAGAVFSIMAIFRTVDRVKMCAGLGIALAVASPLVSQLDWSGVPVLVKNYVAPDFAFFSFFPWAAFFVFGLSAGSIIRLVQDAQMDRTMQWAALLGGVLIFAGRYFSDLPYSIYSKSDFWLDSPALTFIKLGVMLWILAFAFLWTRYAVGSNWSFVAQFGTTSLLVYWVHIELLYGRWLNGWKENLDHTQVVMLSVSVILLMLGLSLLKTSRQNWSHVLPAVLRWGALPPKASYTMSANERRSL